MDTTHTLDRHRVYMTTVTHSRRRMTGVLCSIAALLAGLGCNWAANHTAMPGLCSRPPRNRLAEQWFVTFRAIAGMIRPESKAVDVIHSGA